MESNVNTANDDINNDVSFSLDDIEIRVFKLVSGQDIMGVVIEEFSPESFFNINDDGESEVDIDEEDSRDFPFYLVIDRPMLIHMSHHESGTSAFFTEYNAFARTSTIELNLMHVVASYAVDDDTKIRFLNVVKDIMTSGNESEVDGDTPVSVIKPKFH